MDFERIGNLVGLRYKLLWAKTRNRNGRIALFLSGYLLLVMLVMVLSLGGIGAGVAVVKLGHAEPLVTALLSGVFVQALLATVVLGFGVNEVFSDVELRRYPLRARDRAAARHLIGILDPFWLLSLALYVGLPVGLYLLNTGNLGLGWAAALMLFLANYLTARVAALLVNRLMHVKGGATVLLALIIAASMLPSLVLPRLNGSAPSTEAIVRVLRYAPPAAAARAMTGTGEAAYVGAAVLAAWMVCLGVVLVLIERRPARARVVQLGRLRWESPYEKVGALFGSEYAVLVGQWLRFYSRSSRFRMIYPLALPLVAFLVYTFALGNPELAKTADDRFASALGAFSVIGFLGTAQFAVNEFGYVGPGLRRYFLLPTDPSASFRAGSFTFLLLSAALIPVALLLWLLFAPFPRDGRSLAMLASSAVAALFFIHAIGLWATLYGPRKGNYTVSFGNDLSLIGNIVVIGGTLGMLFVPRLLAYLAPAAVRPGAWWLASAAALAAFVFYRVSLRVTSGLFVTRREQLLGVMEGRQ